MSVPAFFFKPINLLLDYRLYLREEKVDAHERPYHIIGAIERHCKRVYD